MQSFLDQQQLSRLKELKITVATPSQIKQQQGQEKPPQIPPDLFFSGNALFLKELVPLRNVTRSDEILLYHATNTRSLINILEKGIQTRSGTGTLGMGFYVTPSASASIQWARRGGKTVIIELAVRHGSNATVSCIQRNPEFEKKCRTDCMLYTAYETQYMRRYKGGYLPYFWQYVIKDQKYFDQRQIYIRQVFRVLRDTQTSKTGQHRGGAAAV